LSHQALSNIQQAGSGITSGHISADAQTIYGAKSFDAAINAPNLLATGTLNTGDQTITLTGDATGSGTGSFGVEVSGLLGVALPSTIGTTGVLSWSGNDWEFALQNTSTLAKITESGGDPLWNGYAWPGGGGGGTDVVFSPVDWMVVHGAAEGSGGYTVGIEFIVAGGGPDEITGVRFKAYSGRSYTVSIWDVASSTRVATASSGTIGSDCVETVLFSSPFSLTAYKKYAATAYCSSNYTKSAITTPSTIMMCPWISVSSMSRYGSGDNCPSSTETTEMFPVEPYFA
jgi:hypothetical protein